ncbi:MAG: fumarate hydratase C-terminal domain-containing protein [Deltaproteobacteria bacterium]|nr:fumarate hydratase C-terminal domain-containing protein [Deltaproteobacteria bacterium]
MKNIQLPVDEATIRSLQAGDEVRISGIMVTGRDAAHKYMSNHKPAWLKKLLAGSLIYHCGPVLLKEHGKWRITAAGPTTSIREEPYQGEVIKKFGLRGVIGKGGMGAKTLAALHEHGAVYFHAVGGAATLIAQCIEEVIDVHMLDEFGAPEAFWVIRVKDFPAVVTMDTHGTSLHDAVQARSTKKSEPLFRKVVL